MSSVFDAAQPGGADGGRRDGAQPGGAHGVARFLAAVQGRALELPWLMHALRRRLPLPTGGGSSGGGGDGRGGGGGGAEAEGLAAASFCSLLCPPPRRGPPALLLQVRLARCALAHRAWPAADAAALAAACQRLRPHAEKECGAAVAAGLALAEASWRQQAAAPTGVKPLAKGGSPEVGRSNSVLV